MAPVCPEDIRRWRQAERTRLIRARLALTSEERHALSARIAAHLEEAVGAPGGQTVSVYWPVRGEPDLGPVPNWITSVGGRTALPVVVSRDTPLMFRAWSPGDRVEPGAWSIPVPASEAAVVIPDIVVVPLVGFDRGLYRLGYGGGLFDRTVAEMTSVPQLIGVGYDLAAVPTICPQPHDIPMDVIVTETGARRAAT